eukprot:1180028-Prorocentrum_minimum.AAC.3
MVNQQLEACSVKRAAIWKLGSGCWGGCWGVGFTRGDECPPGCKPNNLYLIHQPTQACLRLLGSGLGFRVGNRVRCRCRVGVIGANLRGRGLPPLGHHEQPEQHLEPPPLDDFDPQLAAAGEVAQCQRRMLHGRVCR